MAKVLKDDKLDHELLSEGYVVIPFLDEKDNDELLNFYKKHHQFNIEQMYASAHSEDLSYRQAMSDGISKIVTPKINQYLDEVQALGGSFIVKGSSKQATLPPHQDWNIVDESKHRSFNLWLPLVDTLEENGGLKVIPKSHLWHQTFRGPNISSAYENITDDLFTMHITLDVPVGHAVLYDHRLLHASGPNRTNDLRIVAVIGIIESNANMFIYYRKNNKVEEYEASSTFFMTENPQLGPGNLKLNKTFNWDFPSYSMKDINNGNASEVRSRFSMKYIRSLFSKNTKH